MFAEPLVRGVIESRPNRFVMMVRHGGKLYRCHCPVTGDISSLDFNRGGIACLLSKNESAKAKTDFTVEAISLDPMAAKLKDSKACDTTWIGINQNRANRYVEHFLQQGGLLGLGTSDEKVSKPPAKRRAKRQKVNPSDEIENGTLPKSKTKQEAAEPNPNEVAKAVLADDEAKVQRERFLGKSKIDFLIGENHFCEVKTPLGLMPTVDHPNFDPLRKQRAMTVTDRLIRHFNDLSLLLESDSTAKASVVILFLYDAPMFNPPGLTDDLPAKRRAQIAEIMQAATRARDAGVKTWQLNLRMSPTQVDFTSHFILPDVTASGQM